MIKQLGLRPLHVLLYDFGMNGNQPKSDHVQWIEQYASQVRRSKATPNMTVHRLIFLRGKACSQGQEAHNLALASQRAQSVARIFANALKGYTHHVVPVTLVPQGNDAFSRSVDVTIEEIVSVSKAPPPKPVTPIPVRFYAEKRFRIRIMSMQSSDAAVNYRLLQVGGGRLKASFEIQDIDAKMRAVYRMSQINVSLALKDELMPVSASMDESGISRWVEFTRPVYFPSKTDVERFREYRAGFDMGVFTLGTLLEYVARDGIKIDMRQFYPDADVNRDLKLQGSLSIAGDEFELMLPALPI